MQIVSGNEKVTFSYDKANTAVSEIEDAISQEELQNDDRDAALEMLSEIKEKIGQEKKPSVIKALLVGLKDFLINAGGSLAAGLIQAKIYVSKLNPFSTIWCVIENIFLAATAEGLGCSMRIPLNEEHDIVKAKLKVPPTYMIPVFIGIG